MKGIFFQKPVEFQLHVEGESWSQGDVIRGKLEIRNRGSQEVAIDQTQITLARGDFKKLRAKAPDSFEVLHAAPINSTSTVCLLPAQGTASLEWSFQSDRNCPVTDSGSSLFLIYGMGKEYEKIGQLQLLFRAAPIVEEFIKTLETEFRFVRKLQKTAKAGIDTRLSPPDSKEFSALDELTLNSRFEGDELELRYHFKVKKVEATAASFGIKKEKLEKLQRFKLSELRLPSGRVNYERIENSLRESIRTVESKVIYG